MSHFTQLTTHFTDISRLLAAAQRLGHKVSHQAGVPLQAQGFMENVYAAEAVIHTQSRYDIAIQQQASGEYELVADWELLEKVNKMDKVAWLNKLKQQYALIGIEELAASQGLQLSEVAVAADGSLEVTVNQW